MSTRAKQADQETDLGTTHSTNHHKEIILSIHHTVLDQITEITVTPAARTTKIDKVSTETTLEIKDNNKHETRSEKPTPPVQIRQ